MQEIGTDIQKIINVIKQNFFLKINHEFSKRSFLFCSICQFFHFVFGKFVELKSLS